MRKLNIAAALTGVALAVAPHAPQAFAAQSVRFYTFNAQGVPVRVAAPTGYLIGHPRALHRYWLAQQGNSCGPSTGVDILNQLGVPVTEAESINASTLAGWYDPKVGMTAYGLADEIQNFDAQAHAAPERVTFTQIEALLKAGQPVGAEIDAEAIWHDATDQGHIDHFVTITGYDTRSHYVYLNDTGSPVNAVEAVPLAEFMTAFDAQHNDTIVTTDVSNYAAINASDSGLA